MKVVVAAGGTGGHLYPALALVEYIKKQDPNSKFLFIGIKGSFGISSCSPTWIWLCWFKC